jgi:hypothetical protein
MGYLVSINVRLCINGEFRGMRDVVDLPYSKEITLPFKWRD